eukprot:CAMPEP_0113591908 /NCGR_PEP_ID=MMETSP0015_2-20120614/37540_1 /TAXON_ID=2838 /ORGANISM="Odontella" /LENGTH=392 /DNA_ID=CAMNT_0000498361 /DNA_START=262 /DNA_END=1440 /DNA_ORIENTATION=+ /assembly_acc=CAM_ASM_000160
MIKATFLTERPGVGRITDLLQVGEFACPGAGDLRGNELLVDVKASCVNVDDVHMQEGTACGGVPFMQAPSPSAKSPRVVGCDFSGVVAAVGAKAKKAKVGDKVVGINMQAIVGQQGPWAERVVTKEANVVVLPEEGRPPVFTFAGWASLAMPAFVAEAMYDDADVDGGAPEVVGSDDDDDDDDGRETEKLRCLVVGASGGIGSYLVQRLAAHPRVHVTGVCSAKNAAYVREELGADEVYDYAERSLAEHLRGRRKFHRVFDLVGGYDLELEAVESLLHEKSGRFVTAVGPVRYIGDDKMSAWEQAKYVGSIFVWPFLRNRVFQRNRPSYHFSGPLSFPPDFLERIAKSNIKPAIDRVVPFEKESICEAIQLVKSHRAKGRIVIAVDPDSNQH